jgi:undecaprenyl-diphosphatase
LIWRIGCDEPVAVVSRRSARRAALRGTVAAVAAAPAVGALGAASAFAAGVSVESAPVGAVASLVPVAVAFRQRDRGARSVAVRLGLGAALAIGTRRLWPVAPDTPAGNRTRPVPTSRRTPSPDGAGLTIVVNPRSGPPLKRDVADELREGLPAAKLIELDFERDVVDVMYEAAKGASALGVAGGDGTVNAAAGVALELDLPLLVVPAGTLNHFARDVGLDTVEDAIQAVRAGGLIAADVAEIDGQPFLNTASFGAYVDLVDARQQLEDRIGKWPAVVVALVRVLRRSGPVNVEIDGHRRQIWIAFIGNCRYEPPGFAPSWRDRLDDGILDVRVVEGGHPFARTRLVLAVLTGTLARSRVYKASTTERLVVRSLDGPLRLARDGETFDGSDEIVVAKCERRLQVFVHDAD